MIRLAICDDELAICSQLEELIIKLLDSKSIKYDIDVFYTGEGLCDKLSKEVYDLIFLDIELPNSTGIDVGSYIRETLKDDITQIAYISAKPHYANDLFNSRPINFLHKPLKEEDVKNVLETYLRLTKNNEQLFSYKKGRNYYKIPFEKILYFESMERKIKVVTIDSEDEFYESMEKLYNNLKEYKFLYVHKSYIINGRHIKSLTYDEATMTNNLVIPISQPKRKEIRDMYAQILKERF